MDFYSYKRHAYAKHKSDLPIEERMCSAKLFAEEQAQREHDNIREIYSRTLTTTPISGHMSIESSGRMAMAIYQDMLVEASSKVAKIQGQTVEEYFESLERQEALALENYNNGKIADYANASKQLADLNKNRSLSAKFTNLLGQGDQKREALSEEIDVLCQQYSVAQDSADSWAYMPQEERLDYLLSRIEVEGLTTFDEKGIDSFGKTLSMMRKEGEFSQDVSMAITTISFEE